MTIASPALLQVYKTKFKKALGHLAYSFAKVTKLSHDPSTLSEEHLEIWESFGSRFARASDIFTTKILRYLVMEDDPGFSGSFRDILDRSEKLGLIDSAEDWMKIRALRNVTVHDYSDADLALIFDQLRTLAPIVLAGSRFL